MLWVERNLRRQSSKVWCEEGLDAHFFIKFLCMWFCPRPRTQELYYIEQLIEIKKFLK
jgi:hypothetical protein